MAYAAAAGTTAADGRGRNSPYTAALLSHLETPLEIGLLFRRVRAQVLTGDADRGSYADRNRDVEYARDLGLLAQHDAKRIANPIYAEVIPRELTWVAQDDVEVETACYVDAGGGLDVDSMCRSMTDSSRRRCTCSPARRTAG